MPVYATQDVTATVVAIAGAAAGLAAQAGVDLRRLLEPDADRQRVLLHEIGAEGYDATGDGVTTGPGHRLGHQKLFRYPSVRSGLDDPPISSCTTWPPTPTSWSTWPTCPSTAAPATPSSAGSTTSSPADAAHAAGPAHRPAPAGRRAPASPGWSRRSGPTPGWPANVRATVAPTAGAGGWCARWPSWPGPPTRSVPSCCTG
ncbi:MAG: hypothetical protein R2746_08335 [Acidimicrobiales bacterium]